MVMEVLTGDELAFRTSPVSSGTGRLCVFCVVYGCVWVSLEECVCVCECVLLVFVNLTVYSVSCVSSRGLHT